MSYRRNRKKVKIYTVQVVSPSGNIVTWIGPGNVEPLALDWSKDPSKDDFRFVGVDKSGYSVGQWSISEILAGWFRHDVL